MPPPHSVLFESMESRSHFSASPVVADSTASSVVPAATASQRDFSVRVNFAPETAPKVRGSKLDYGAKFSQRGNGLRYGWNTDRRANATYTDDPRYDSPKAESNIAMKGATWSIVVPNGWYQVSALMGTPSNLNAEYDLDANGQIIVNGIPYKPNFPWIEGTKLLKVTGGKITFSSGAAAKNNVLCSLAIMSADAPPVTPQDIDIKWTRSNIQSPVHRAEAGSVRVGNKLYVLGGYDKVYDVVYRRLDILDLKTGKSTRGADTPGPQSHFGMATDGTSIYTAGGQFGPQLLDDGTNAVWKYDIAKNKWSKFVALPTIRFGGTLAYLNGKLHFVGGDDKTRVRSQDEHFVLDLKKLRKGWYEAAPLPTPSDHLSSIVVNNNLYVLGGEVEHGTSYIQNDGFYQYNARTNKWITLPPLPVAASHNEASTLTDGKRIFLVGGQVNQQQLTDEVRSFDFKRNRWVLHTPLPTARKAGISWLQGDTLYYMTGDDAKYGEPRWTYQGKIGA